MKRHRRVTENNIDLNRNCTSNDADYQNPNDGYTKVYDMLNPKGKANHRSFRNRHQHLIVMQKLLAHTMGALRQAIMQGQYEYPEGLNGHCISFPILWRTRTSKPKWRSYSQPTRSTGEDSQTTFGSIRSLHNLILENQDYRYDYKTIRLGS